MPSNERPSFMAVIILSSMTDKRSSMVLRSNEGESGNRDARKAIVQTFRRLF